MGIVEFGPGQRHQRGIVPAEERAKAEDDAAVYGFGYLYDERRLDPAKVEIILAPDSPTMLGQAMNEYIQMKDRERG